MDIKKIPLKKTVSIKDVIKILDQITNDLENIYDGIDALKVLSSTFYDGVAKKCDVLDKTGRLLSTVCDLCNKLEKDSSK